MILNFSNELDRREGGGQVFTFRTTRLNALSLKIIYIQRNERTSSLNFVDE